jgi:molecular chaperone DnaK (HSP70)
MPYVLGVAIGNGYTVAGLSRRTREGWSPVEPAMGTGSACVPSVLHLDPDGVATGGPGACEISGFAGRVGDDVPLVVDGWRYPAAELTAELAGWVADQAATLAGEAPERFVLVIPGGWGPYRRDLVEDALWQVGLDEVTLLAEPLAVAQAYAAVEPVEPGTVLAVYSHGGTGGECTVVRRGGAAFEVLAYAPIPEGLGGDDLDDLVPGGRVVKEELSYATEVAVSPELTVTRAGFEERVRPLLEAAVAILARTVRAAGVEPAAVLLTGGTARIPLVRRLVEAAVPAPVAGDVDPVRGALCVARALTSRTPLIPAQRTAPDRATEDGLPARPPRPPVTITPLDPPRRGRARHVARQPKARIGSAVPEW